MDYILIKGISAFEAHHLQNFLDGIVLGCIEFFGAGQITRFYFLDGFRPTPSSAACARRFESCLGPLTDHIPLKLCHRSNDMKQELACGGGSVDILLQASQLNASLCEHGHRFDQLLEGSA
jgi:hypothetical protein